MPHLLIPVQAAPQQNTSVQTAPKNITPSSEAVLSTNLNWKLLLPGSNTALKSKKLDKKPVIEASNRFLSLSTFLRSTP